MNGQRAAVGELRLGRAPGGPGGAHHLHERVRGAAVAPARAPTGIAEPTRLLVVHDELDLEPGRLQLKVGGGIAGHNGLRSIKATLKSDAFLRLRIGVGKPPSKEAGVNWVLGRPRGGRRPPSGSPSSGR